jgi:hypothetical protein
LSCWCAARRGRWGCRRRAQFEPAHGLCSGMPLIVTAALSNRLNPGNGDTCVLDSLPFLAPSIRASRVIPGHQGLPSPSVLLVYFCFLMARWACFDKRVLFCNNASGRIFYCHDCPFGGVSGAGREKKSTFAGLSTTQVVETWLGENDFSRFFLTTAVSANCGRRRRKWY